jgi:hypothetical protein
MADIFFLDSENGWICGDYKIMKTTDGGDSWDILYSGINWFNGIVFTDLETGWAFHNGGVMATTNGGLSWTNQFLPEAIIPSSISFPIPSKGWLTGLMGEILVTENGGFVGLDENPIFNSDAISSEYYHKSISVCPNPATVFTELKFCLGEDTFGYLKIISSEGKIIRTIEMMDLMSGGNYYYLDIQGIPSGIYFLELLTVKEVMNGKLFIISD